MIIYCDNKEEPIVGDSGKNMALLAQGQLFLGLPDPVKQHVLKYLSLGDLSALTLTCNACFKLLTYQSLPLWEKLCLEKNYIKAPVLPLPPNVTGMARRVKQATPQEENWRRAFINGQKLQLLKKWRDLEKKLQQKRYIRALPQHITPVPHEPAQTLRRGLGGGIFYARL